MALLVVTVRPNARRPGIRVEGESVEIRVTAPPREGAANEAVRRALASALGLPLRAVTLARGGTSKHKAFEVEGPARADMLERLRRVAEAVEGGASSKDG